METDSFGTLSEFLATVHLAGLSNSDAHCDVLLSSVGCISPVASVDAGCDIYASVEG